MRMENSRQQIIPPNRVNVKAGFVVYTPGSEERSIVILNDGELAARNKDNPNEIIFTMHPGDLVGVAALLEREPFHHEIVAIRDSSITIVNEECMESELQRLPVWLLAVIRNMSSKTRRLKYASNESQAQNTQRSLAEYCSHKPAKTQLFLTDLLLEFSWLTRVPKEAILEDFKSLARRHLIAIQKINERIACKITDPELLKIFVDYQESLDQAFPFAPYKLTDFQKRTLAALTTVEATVIKRGHEWLTSIKADISEWLILVNMGWFKELGDDNFCVDAMRVRYFLKALRYETNIRGVI